MTTNKEKLPANFNPTQELASTPQEVKSEYTTTTTIVKDFDYFRGNSAIRFAFELAGVIAGSATSILTDVPQLRTAATFIAVISVGAVIENTIWNINVGDYIHKKQNQMMETVWNSLPESRRQEIINNQ